MGGTTSGPVQTTQQQNTGYSSFNGTTNQQSQAQANSIANAIQAALSGQQSTGQTTAQLTPYAASKGLLDSILTGAGNVNPNLTPTQASAIAALTGLGAQGSPFTGQTTALANQLYGGLPNQAGTINSAYQDYLTRLSPTANGAYLDPSQNGQLQKYLDVARMDATNNINSLFAGAGRDLSGAHVQALGRGIGQAEAPILYDAYNQALSRQAQAAQNLYGAGAQTTGILSGLDLANLQAQLQAPGVAQQALASSQYGPLLQLQAQSQLTGIPIQTLASLSGITLPISTAFGTQAGTTAEQQTGQQFGTGQQTGTQTQNATSSGTTSGSGYNLGNSFGQSQTQIPTWQVIGGGLLGGLGLAGSLGWKPFGSSGGSGGGSSSNAYGF